MTAESRTTLKVLCEHESFRVRRKIIASYWSGCADGLKIRDEMDGRREAERFRKLLGFASE